MERIEVIERQRGLIEELARLVSALPVGLDALERLCRSTDGARLERGLLRRSYLGLLIGLNAGATSPSEFTSGQRAARLVCEIEDLEYNLICSSTTVAAEGKNRQRRALYARVSWPRSLPQLRVGLGVRSGLRPEAGNYGDQSLSESASPADRHIEATFAKLGAPGIRASDVVCGLVRLSGLFARQGDVTQDDVAALADPSLSQELLFSLVDLLTSDTGLIQRLWRENWRHAEMHGAMVPHGLSAAEFSPLLSLPGGRLLALQPRCVAISAEHLVDDLILGRGRIWREFANTNQAYLEGVRDARGAALEAAVASAVGTSLRREPCNPPSVHTGIAYTTQRRDWLAEGEVDVLAGCGGFQIAVECKADDYNGRSVTPKDFFAKPRQQLRRWHAARQSSTLRMAADEFGSPLPAPQADQLGRIVAASVCLDLIVTLDDFGLMPTASQLMFGRHGGSEELATNPVQLCLPDLWEICEVLESRDLLTYLASRTRLARGDAPIELPEDGCLAMFLARGDVAPTDLEGRTGLLQRASRDPAGLFAWKIKRQHSEAASPPSPLRSSMLTEVLSSLSGPDAEIAHAAIASMAAGEFDDQAVPSRPWILKTMSRILLVLDKLPDPLVGWAQSKTFFETALECFRTNAQPALIVSVHVDNTSGLIAVNGDPAVLLESSVGRIPLEEGLLRKRALLDLRSLKLPPYSICPCGSGKKVKWCVGENDHPVPLKI